MRTTKVLTHELKSRGPLTADTPDVYRRGASLLASWRKQLANVAPPKKRGRPANPLTAELNEARLENARLQRRVAKAEKMVDALGKAHALLQMLASESAMNNDESKIS